MINPTDIYNKLINLLDQNNVEYKLFSHKEALTWEELEEVQKETGFFGTEIKCMVFKTDLDFFVYITIQGKKVDFKAIKNKLLKKVRLATAEELMEYFGAKPGCAYPFGFDSSYNIFLDPEIFNQEWALFSPVLPTKTVQAKGSDLKNVFDNLENSVEIVTNFNQT